MLVHSLSWLVSGIALIGVGYALIVARLVRGYAEGASRSTEPQAVTILKPLHFDEPGLSQALASFLAQDYAGPVQIVFGVQSAADPAIAVVEGLKRDFPLADIALVVDTKQHGSNRKVSNLINMNRVARHDILIVSDSDISVRSDWLARVTAALSGENVGAVSCLYAGRSHGNAWSMLGAMGSTYEFLPNVIAGLSFGLAAPCFGSTVALRRETLDRIGGFRAFADQLADDYEMGRAVRGAGLKVAIPAFAVDHGSAESDWTTLYRHELRWNRTTHVIDPVGHTGSLITHPLPIAIFGVLLSGFAAANLAILAAALVSRLLLKWSIERKFATQAGPAWALPLRDALSFAVFIASLFGEDVHWRGSRFAVSQGGALSQS